MNQKVAIVISKNPKLSLELVAKNLTTVLGVKTATAKSILNNLPLKVYHDLDPYTARIIVEALNITTLIDWEMQAMESCKYPKVHWNKIPQINGMRIEAIMQKNDPIKTGVAEFFPGFMAPSEEDSADGTASESNILDAAESFVTHLSEDLEAVYQKKSQKTPQKSDDSLPAFMTDDQMAPGLTNGNILKPGFYNLYLPALKSSSSRKLAEEICETLLSWDSKTIKEAFARPIICVAKNVDHLDGDQLISDFEKHGVQLNSKLISKI